MAEQPFRGYPLMMNSESASPINPKTASGGFPADWQELLFGALGLRPGDEVRPEFLEALYYFNRSWVQASTDRGTVGAVQPAAAVDYAAPQADPRAYACFYMTINMPKLWFVLERTPALPTGDGDWGLTELGCGPGTFLWAYLLWLHRHAPASLARLREVTGVDRSPAMLETARRIAARFRARPEFRHLTFTFQEADWHQHLQRPADVLLFGNVLNEQGADAADWIAAVSARAIVIIEPGTVATFRPLLPVRDALIRSGWQVQFPCIRADTPCPMRPEDWCHFCVNRFQLPFIQRMANRAGRLNPRHNFSAFVLIPSQAPDAATTATPAGMAWRVLSNLRKANRSGIRWLCDGCRLREVVLSRRERTPANRAFLDADWGDRLQLQPGPTRNDPGRSGRIAGDDRLEVEDR